MNCHKVTNKTNKSLKFVFLQHQFIKFLILENKKYEYLTPERVERDKDNNNNKHKYNLNSTMK